MNRIILIVLFIFTSSIVHAECNRPELSLSITQDNGNTHNSFSEWDRSNGDSISLSFTIPLGTDHLCQESIALKRAETRQINADIQDRKQYNLEHKINICRDFTFDNAPGSIKRFCGDLLTN